MSFFDTIGKVVNPKNILTGAGFLVGGPPGAGVGRGLGEATFGGNWKPFFADEEGGSGVGEIAGEGALGFGMGHGAQALGVEGGSFSNALGDLGIIDSGAGAAQAAGAGGAGGGSAAAGGGGGAASQAAGGLSTMDKLMLGSSAAQGAGNIVSGVQEGKAARERMDMIREDRKRKQRLARLLRPHLERALQGVTRDFNAAG